MPNRKWTCVRCKKKKNAVSFKTAGNGVCGMCVRLAKSRKQPARPPRPTARASAFPTIDVAVSRDRLVRVQRVNSLIRFLSAVPLDAGALRVFGHFTVPVSRVAELQRALAQLVAP